MNNQLIKKLNLNATNFENFYGQIFEKINLSSEEYSQLKNIFLNYYCCKREKVSSEKELKRNIIMKTSSIIYQILKRNTSSFSILVKNYSKKVNNGSKPDSIFFESKVKIKKILKILLEKKIIIRGLKGYLLDSTFRNKILI